MAPFFFSLRKVMHLQNTWAPIIRAALDEYLNKKSGTKPTGVPAAPLKPLLIRQAQQAGLTFPPEGYAHLKFVDFLDLFPSVVQTRRRPGQDALVAKAEDVRILDDLAQAESEQTHEKRERIAFRPDVFRAFTKILPTGTCYCYSKATDEFVEVVMSPVDKSFIQLPLYTLGDAISERKNFANTVTDVDQQRALLEALRDSATALGTFSQVVKEKHLEHKWHVFRFDYLKQRIRNWANTAKLDWNPAWMSSAKSTKQETDMVTARETNSFLAGLMQLGPEDAKRVMVPLDIVLKLMRRD